MFRHRLSVYLRTHRKKWGLTQSELGRLLGLSKGSVSAYELGKRTVSARLLVACTLIFGEPVAEIFPDFSEDVEDEVGARAQTLIAELEGRIDRKAERMRTLLEAIPDRVTPKDV